MKGSKYSRWLSVCGLVVLALSSVTVTVPYSAADASGPPVCSISVSSNERTDGRGDGHTATDWQVLDGHTVLLRAERSGTGTRRIYTVTVSCTDGSGNAASGAATVSVSR
jgi:hypothetical protein